MSITVDPSLKARPPGHDAAAAGSGSRRWTRFLLTWLVGTVGLVVAVIGLNVVVDPFFVFGTPLIPGLNQYKPATQGRETLAKAALLPRTHPRTVLIGASKVQVGIDPTSSVWPAADQPVLNLGIPGKLSATTLRILEDAVAAAPVRRVLLFIEFIDMLEPSGPADTGYPFLKSGWAETRDLVDAALTRDALEASLQTIAEQWTDLPSGLRPNGQMYDGIFRGPTDAEGPGAVFGQKMVLNSDRVVALRARLGRSSAPGVAQLDVVRRIVALCRERGVELDLALPPVHADFLRLLDLAGLWPRYLEMRRALADEVALAGEGQVRLWNFMGFDDERSTEVVPPLGARAAALRWFWEPNHFRPEFGQLLLEAIYDGRQGVGERLTPQNVAAGDETQNAALARDQSLHPGEWDRARAALDAAVKRAAR